MDNPVHSESVISQMKLHKTKVRDPKVLPAEPEEGLFERRFFEHWGPIYRHLLRLVGDPAEAEDLALETFFRLHQRHAAPDEEFNVGGWLYRVATNLGLQSIRSFKRREHYELTAGRDALEIADDTRPAEVLIEKQEQHLVREVLAHMNERRSQLLILRHSGLSYREIARSQNLSPASIGPLLLRAEREFEEHYRRLNQEEL
jgi:RNA polymerase sigma-70 factor, ECF subfamily